MQQIEWEDFQRVELRVGTVLSAGAWKGLPSGSTKPLSIAQS